jgi:Na+-translocating ferredoxin:NAD+ oxidoreductase RnfC subunit
MPCTVCGCVEARGEPAHRIVDALRVDDVDRALDAGLLDAIECDACAPACRALLAQARGARITALAARDRFRARNARLECRRAERDARRTPVATPEVVKPTLPPAAAAALARAKARAAQRKPE